MRDEKNRNKAINRDGSLPIYRQLKKIIKSKIVHGEFKPGTRIPTEYELCTAFSISRTSVRQALAELANEGFLSRQQGSGTFVNHQPSSRVKPLRVMISEERWIPPLREAVRLYNEEQEDGKISLKFQILGRPQLHSKIISAVGRGEAPDIALLDWAWEAEFAKLHFLKPLDELDQDWVKEFKADLLAPFIDTDASALYGIQPEANVSVIWYRKDWLAREDVAPPKSWDELVAVARHFKRFNRFPLAFAGGTRAGETTTYQLLPFIWSAGGSLFSDRKVALDENAVRAVSFLVDLIHVHSVASPNVVSFEWDQPARLFAQSEVALAIGGSYEKALIQEVSGWKEREFQERVDCIPIPAAPGGHCATMAGGMVYAIFRQSQRPALALEILKRAASPPLMKAFCVETGRSPTCRSVVQTLDPDQDWFSYRVAQLLGSARARLSIPEYHKISEQFQWMMEQALTRQLSPHAAVDKAREFIAFLIS